VRRLAARVHLWGGLLLGPVVLVLGLSGAALVFREELDALGTAPATVARGAPRALDAIAAAALLTEPNGEVRALAIPSRSGQPYRVQIAHGARQVDVLVDPVTLRVVDSRAPERSLMAAVRSLHAGFHAGRPGVAAVGVIGAALVAESVTGIWLYGPRLRRRRHGGRRRSRGLHRLVGGASLALGLVIGVTGVALALAGLGRTARPATPGGLVRLDALAARARATLPDGTLAALIAAGDGLARADVRVTGEVTSVLLDRATMAVVAVQPASASGGWALVRRLHYGDFAGWLSRLAWVLTGLALPALTITGYLAATRPRASS